MKFWLRADDEGRFRETPGRENSMMPYAGEGLYPDNPEIELLEGDDDIDLSILSKNFVLGEKGIWMSGGDQLINIPGNSRGMSAYPDGLMFIPYRAEDIMIPKTAITENPRTETEELLYHGDFMRRVFRTFAFPSITKITERDQHLLVYAQDNK